MRRAVEGVEPPMIHRRHVAKAWVENHSNYVPGGGRCGPYGSPLDEQEYSDTLLLFAA
jgi:hypothetical protein